MTATMDDRTVLVPNHRRLAPAESVLFALEELQPATADAIAEDLDISTRDVVATLNVLRGGENPLVRRFVPSDDAGKPLAAHWSLA